MEIKRSRAAPAESFTWPCYHPGFLMSDRPSSPLQDGAPDRATALNFPAFIWSLAHTAAVHFGDVADPSTGAPGEVNLLGAQHMIDILTLLEEKTRGNLSAEERQLLEQVIFELRMRYMEAVGAAVPPPSRIILP